MARPLPRRAGPRDGQELWSKRTSCPSLGPTERAEEKKHPSCCCPRTWSLADTTQGRQRAHGRSSASSRTSTWRSTSGPASVDAFAKAIRPAGATLLEYGPMGLFETPPSRRGHPRVARGDEQGSRGFTVVGGGDSVAAVQQAGLADRSTTSPREAAPRSSSEGRSSWPVEAAARMSQARPYRGQLEAPRDGRRGSRAGRAILIGLPTGLRDRGGHCARCTLLCLRATQRSASRRVGWRPRTSTGRTRGLHRRSERAAAQGRRLRLRHRGALERRHSSANPTRTWPRRRPQRWPIGSCRSSVRRRGPGNA